MSALSLVGAPLTFESEPSRPIERDKFRSALGETWEWGDLVSARSQETGRVDDELGDHCHDRKHAGSTSTAN